MSAGRLERGTPTQVQQTVPRPTRADPRRTPTLPAELLIVLGGALFAGITMLTNIAGSPDTQYDEVVYTRAAQQVAQDWHLTWTNSPMFVHPPLSFLTQAAWLRLMGLGSAPLVDAIISARILTALTTVFAILLLGLLTAYLMPSAGRARSLLVVGLVVAFAATDPVLLRYGRLALIEPFALVAGVLTLCLVIRLRAARALVYVPVIGLATGLTLLTKEVTAFLLFTPVVYALLGRNRRRVAVTFGAFVWGLGLWTLFPLWAVALGLSTDFVDVKFATFQRLLGLLQITGWNRPGVSFVSAIAAQLGQYATSYLFLAGGGAALVWLLTRNVHGPSRWLLSWLVTSYAFAAYMVLIGTLNEQFFVYILPASIVGTVLMGDAAVARLNRSGPRPALTAAAAVAAALVLATSVAGWVRLYTTNNAAVFAITDMVRTTLPRCAVFTTTGDGDRFSYLLPGNVVATFATAEGALAHGVHMFVISDKDVTEAYGNATTKLTSWVRANGTLDGSYDTFTYRGLQVWRTPLDPYAPLADTEPFEGGSFVITDDNRCGGFPVVDGPTGRFASGVAALGGKQVLGAPMTSSWQASGGGLQVFTGAVLSSTGDQVVALPVVQRLASAAGGAYGAANLPPVTVADARQDYDDVQRLLTDPAITAAYLRGGDVAAARSALGDPVGPATTMPDGAVRQAFTGGVLERQASSDRVRLAPIGKLVLDAGIVTPDDLAATPLAAPPLPSDFAVPQPTTVRPFVTSLLAGLAIYTAIPVLAFEAARLLRRRRPRRRT